MRSRTLTTTLACGGALAYTISKIDLALRERIGMPGFPAPPSSYEDIPNVAAAQLGNAALGFVLILLTAALFHPPNHTLTRRVLLGANWLGVAMVGAGVVGFTLRAAGLAPALGQPASETAAWISLTVGAVWTVSWALSVHSARRTPNV